MYQGHLVSSHDKGIFICRNFKHIFLVSYFYYIFFVLLDCLNYFPLTKDWKY